MFLLFLLWTFLFFVQRSKKNARWHLDFAAEACIIPMQAVEQTIPPEKTIKEMIINKELICKLADYWGETDYLETVYETDNVLSIIFSWCEIIIYDFGDIEVDLYQSNLDNRLLDFLNDFKEYAEEIYKSEDE